jgi:hypothetical protein
MYKTLPLGGGPLSPISMSVMITSGVWRRFVTNRATSPQVIQIERLSGAVRLQRRSLAHPVIVVQMIETERRSRFRVEQVCQQSLQMAQFVANRCHIPSPPISKDLPTQAQDRGEAVGRYLDRYRSLLGSNIACRCRKRSVRPRPAASTKSSPGGKEIFRINNFLPSIGGGPGFS